MHSLNILLLFPTLTFARFISRDTDSNITTIPTCAVTCSLQVASRTRCSDPTDSSCSCKDPIFRKEALACYHRQCDEADLKMSIQFAKDTCAKAGHSNITDIIVSNTSSTNNATMYSPTNALNISDSISVGPGNLTNIKTGDPISNTSSTTTNTQPINSTPANDSTFTSTSSSSTLQIYASNTLLLTSILYSITILYINSI